MKYSEIIRNAALTARLLGFKIVREPSSSRDWYIAVKDSRGAWVYKAYATTVKSLLEPTNQSMLEPTDQSMLGHWIVRLHMEKHYGIKTDHYWE